jgi:hypothetical protein
MRFSRRIVLLAALTLMALAALPAVASANSRQSSIFEDDAVFLGLTKQDPDKALAEAKYLGADSIRVFVVWSRVSPGAKDRTIPAGFDPADPNSPGYDWRLYDTFMKRARAHGLKVILSLSAEIPYWASNQPSKCPHHIGGYDNLALSCMWKPSASRFQQFAHAAALRYKGQISQFSLWNEPNLEHQLYPQVQRGVPDYGAKQLRSLWVAGYRGAVSADPRLKNRVLFGETAAISSPMDTLYGALCLNQNGKPFTGKAKIAQGCAHPSKLPIGGLAVHPYNKDASGNVFTRSFTTDSMSMAYLSRATRLLRVAEKYKRIPKGRGIYVTEFGFQSNPPDRRHGLGLQSQARALNEADRLFFGDRRVKAVSQFELYDAPELKTEDVYNTGLRQANGKLKPSWGAYRMPLVVTKISPTQVEVWGQVRPATRRTRVALLAGRPGAKPKRIGRPATNPAGYFRIRVKRGSAATLRYRFTWPSPNGETFSSRTAIAGRAIQYREKP